MDHVIDARAQDAGVVAPVPAQSVSDELFKASAPREVIVEDISDRFGPSYVTRKPGLIEDVDETLSR